VGKKVNYRTPGNWDLQLTIGDDGNTADNSTLQLAVLCVIRDELKKLNGLLHCQNFIEIPSILRSVRRNTAKKKRPKKQAPKLRVVRS
jgi:hypothetical protein